MYKSVIRPVLFSFDPESIHHTTFNAIKAIHALPGMGSLLKSWYRITDPRLETEVFGLKFPNPVGLAAGFDKDAKLYRELANFGFGFIEIGTLTPKPQPGNDKPRLFRLPEDKALINRMGFNNQGVEAAVARLKKRQPGLIIGGNIGKNKITPNEDAILDYELAFEALYPHVDYFVVNVSSPNTPNLRALQDKEPLTKLLRHLQNLRTQKSISKPILLKIAPDLSHGQLDDIAEMALAIKLDGIIATNTTLSREGLKTDLDRVKQIGMGGVSGKPVTQMSTEVIAHLGKAMNHKVPLIGVGGIFKPEDALKKLDAGASLVQVYTGFIYEGPGMVKRINKAILEARGKKDYSPQPSVHSPQKRK